MKPGFLPVEQLSLQGEKMNNAVRACFLLSLLNLSAAVFADQVPMNGNYWQCTTYDASNKQWSAASAYQRVALNFAYDLCKKESILPNTCKAAENNCEQFIQGISVKPMWQCTALDKTATAWNSNLYSQRDDAALAAKAFCRQKSIVPETCYVNLVTCINKKGIN